MLALQHQCGITRGVECKLLFHSLKISGELKELEQQIWVALGDALRQLMTKLLPERDGYLG
jgi:hypothetical protein